MANYTYPDPVLEENSIAVGYVEDTPTGLCSNCNRKSICSWKDNNKIYCEHYL
ncbi:MAG TPA: hypothetical protein VK010_02045 [Flavobacteriaceae bacterium]|nr:hypothetical protein [Flavobacteriaceae bacterium]